MKGDTFLIAMPDLLIVPYGIETLRYLRSQTLNPLLIVPYGIETQVDTPFSCIHLPAFNRSLWN